MLVRDRIEALSGNLTASERRLCAALLLDYPFAGLEPIQDLANKVSSSPPTISRFVNKLGFSGFQEFQRQLIVELKEGQRSPVDLKRTSKPVEGAFLGNFTERARSLLSEATTAISEDQFELICNKLADPKRSIYVIGGRMSDSLALYLSRHLRQLRTKVYHLPTDPEVWPEYLLRMKPRDVLFVADFRRYQRSLETLSEKASVVRKVHVVLLTDKWMSPISAQASDVLALPIDNDTLWDSYVGALVLLEAIVTRIAEYNWDQTKTRIEAWDRMRSDFGDHKNDS